MVPIYLYEVPLCRYIIHILQFYNNKTLVYRYYKVYEYFSSLAVTTNYFISVI